MSTKPMVTENSYKYDCEYQQGVEYGGQYTEPIVTPEEMGYDRVDWELWTIQERKEAVDEYFKELSDNR